MNHLARLDEGFAPADFEAVFVEVGRLECEKYYRAGRTTITRWLEERGKERLIAERWNYVLSYRAAKSKQRREGLSRKDMGRILSHAFPLDRANLSSRLDCKGRE